MDRKGSCKKEEEDGEGGEEGFIACLVLIGIA